MLWLVPDGSIRGCFPGSIMHALLRQRPLGGAECCAGRGCTISPSLYPIPQLPTAAPYAWQGFCLDNNFQGPQPSLKGWVLFQAFTYLISTYIGLGSILNALINPHQLRPPVLLLFPVLQTGDTKSWRGCPKAHTVSGEATIHTVAQDRNLRFEPKQLGPRLCTAAPNAPLS